MTHDEAITLYKELSGVMGVIPTPDSVKDKIRRLYEYVTGWRLRRCNCQDLYNDALIIITLNINQMENRKYKLKRGVVIQVPGTTEVYTHVNLTDEVARAYLAKYPNKAKLFEAIPQEVEDKTAEDAQAPAEDAQAPAEDDPAPAEVKKKSKRRKK